MTRKWLFVTPLLLLALAACNDDDTPAVRKQSTADNRYTTNNVSIPPNFNEQSGFYNGVTTDHTNGRMNATNVAEARSLEAIAKRVNHVEGARAVVAGPYTVVGIDVPSRLNTNETERVKQTVAEALKRHSRGQNAFIVSDVDTKTRLSNMATSIENGKPLTGIIRELGAVISRLSPQTKMSQ